ncbi:hypothetical protein [Conservatibacter flavescens]|uniref:Uncharacterized protein n=1 Tax=Conservatibacter flavescens TaxID=28161 RepID=A0A2M8S4Z4_9PAST|nr:hypothetical protein [Conservatibacter flavescens]PJG86201.1 hypothetical protein CVP05_03250 [Conservatibacter flavescens]
MMLLVIAFVCLGLSALFYILAFLLERKSSPRLAKYSTKVKERRDCLKEAIKQGNRNPVSRAKRGRYV